MNRPILAASAALSILVGCSGAGPTPAPTATPTPAPTAAPTAPPAPLIARGTFKLYGADVELNATGSGDIATGTMAVSHGDGNFTVDLKCTTTTDDGVILLAGDITDSTSPYAREGAREVLVLKPGSPVYASFDSEGRPGGDVTPAESCMALLEQVIDTGTQTVIGPNGLEPIEGTVELAG
jgi:hypothetical protein